MRKAIAGGGRQCKPRQLTDHAGHTPSKAGQRGNRIGRKDILYASHATQGLRVNAVAPGMTETPMTAGMLKMPAMREGAARQYPLGGVQTAEQVAVVVAWLLGNVGAGAARLTGQVIAVDGGFTTVRPLVK